jgi:hypothetical protein
MFQNIIIAACSFSGPGSTALLPGAPPQVRLRGDGAEAGRLLVGAKKMCNATAAVLELQVLRL